ncbi:hypothetical protein [Pedobacter sp. MC2016-24]|uniref:hypothetical protein n=1 Tax=Pedobacter sp. MC2016-24 TaxID=2780090 RepID=UPI00187FB137|nr:hypothetical protein [Pedobacter sp. MC2016-24]MBE9602373.1 hypothetical protein [Pedobacter sp. MC2016-24]
MPTIRESFLKGVTVILILGCGFEGKTIMSGPVAIKINMVVQSVKHEGDSLVLLTNKDHAELINVENINILKDPMYTERGEVKNSNEGFVDGEVVQEIAYEDHVFYVNAKYGIKFHPKNQSKGIEFKVDSLLKPYGYNGVNNGNFRLDKEIATKNLSYEFYTPKVKNPNSADSLILKYDLDLKKITFFTFSSTLDATKKGKLSGVYYVLNKTADRPRIQISSEIALSVPENPLEIQKLISRFKEQKEK